MSSYLFQLNKDEVEDVIQEQEETAVEPPQKLSPTEMLKKQMIHTVLEMQTKLYYI